MISLRGDSTSLEGVDLILHQRDQRRDHDRRSLEQSRRKLEAKAFASARRHYSQRVLPTKKRLHQSFLAGAKLRKTELLFKLTNQIIHGESTKTIRRKTDSGRSIEEATSSSKRNAKVRPMTAAV